MTINQEEFKAKVKASLDASVSLLDKETQDKLTVIRQTALKTQQAKARFSLNALVPAGAFAFCAVLTVFLLYKPISTVDVTQQIATRQNSNSEQTEQIAMLELLNNSEDIETATDADFYVWMDEVLAAEGADNAV